MSRFPKFFLDAEVQSVFLVASSLGKQVTQGHEIEVKVVTSVL